MLPKQIVENNIVRIISIFGDNGLIIGHYELGKTGD